MDKVTESIFSGKTVIIPMADVSHIEKHWYSGDEIKDDTTLRGFIVVTKHTVWNQETDFWNNNIFLAVDEGKEFCEAWCTYRSELESETLQDLSA